jgi:hypothetical protein
MVLRRTPPEPSNFFPSQVGKVPVRGGTFGGHFMAHNSLPTVALARQFCTLAEYQRITGRSPASAFRDLKQGRIPHVRIGHAILIPTSFFSDLERKALEAQGGE